MFSSAASRFSTDAKGLKGGICFPLASDRAIQSHQRSSTLVPLVIWLDSGNEYMKPPLMFKSFTE